MQRIESLRRQLHAALAPDSLEIIDESAQHVGHPGAQAGGGHFEVIIVSAAFAGKGLLQRHRMVYDALASSLHHDIHALSIKAYAPDEL